MFKLQGLKEWYARFRGRKFYTRVRNIYTRSNEITLSDKVRKNYLTKVDGGKK